jgi:hypothetical protein
VEQNYTIESLKGKHKERCAKIISWIGSKNEFWLDELKQEFGYDSKETRIPVNAVINYMKGQKLLRQSGYDNKRRQYVLADNANTQDILTEINQEN